MAQTETNYKEKRLPLILNEVPEELKLKAKTDLNETEENVKKGLQLLRDCIRRENLPFSTEESFLLAFLRPAKFDFKKAEEKLKRFMKVWERFTELLKTTRMEKFEAVIDSKMIGLLPFRDNQGRTVFYARANAWNKELFDMDDVTLCAIGLSLYAALYPLTQVCGITYIDDTAIDSILDYYPMFKSFRKFLPLLSSMPFRFSRMDYVNEHAVCRYFFMAVKTILPAKFRKRVWFHGAGFEALRKIYHPSMLPHEFGGTLGPLRTESYRNKFLGMVEKLKFQLENTHQITFGF